jgi:hypothetical protein
MSIGLANNVLMLINQEWDRHGVVLVAVLASNFAGQEWALSAPWSVTGTYFGH